MCSMLLAKLTIENFGPFRGIHEFDLMPIDKTKPIILFGGKNGSGKTTIFEAIKLCLYGNAFNGHPLSQSEYEAHLKKRVHRYAGLIIQPDFASITLEFKYSHLGNINTYKIKRFWKIKGEEDKTKVSEYVEIYENGKLLEDVEGYQWNSFIRNLIPQGLTDLYFFDGEKIQQLADEGLIENNNGRANILKESFYTLFGLDIIERAKIDLAILKEKSIKDRTSSKLEDELKNLNVKKEEIRRKLELLNDERASIQNKVNYILGQIEKQEQLISLEGGVYAIKREELNTRKEMLDKEIEEIEADIRKLAEGLLPFTLSYKYCKKVKEHILEEDEIYKKIVPVQILQERISRLEDKISSFIDRSLAEDGNNIISIKKEETIRILTYLLGLIKKELINPTDDMRLLVHDSDRLIYNNYFSAHNRQKLLQWVSELESISAHFHSLAKRLDKVVYEKQEVEKALMHCPPEESITTLIKDLNRLHSELGEEKVRLTKIDEDIRRLEREYDETERLVNKIMEQLKAIKVSTKKELLIDKLHYVFEEFMVRLKEEKLRELEENLLFTLKTLLHKEICNKVRIDPTNFVITLYKDTDDNGNNNNKIIKENLSSGEKQIYAIALLWSLTRCSNKPMPFIIDTPLARLDSKHRSNLIYNFFPNASHQVIILSTDTEIDKVYFDKLKPYISIAYQLVYNEGAVTAQRGYFYTEEEVNNEI